jgi:Mn2+/Fe2+ NRAMP family transporter
MQFRINPELARTLGPGLLMAGAAVGVSHLVQSTRAGAEYGFLLLGLVLLACALKYPFLEFGPRYAAATGRNLLEGYRSLGRWALALYAAITLGTMFVILASVTLVTAGLAGMVFGLELPPVVLAAGVLAACLLILLLGRFRGLDLSMKLIMGVLAISTLAALFLALSSPAAREGLEFGPPVATLWTGAGIAFLLALMGWMPIPLDVAAWHSLWVIERRRQTGHAPSVRHAVFDFRLGYVGASLLAAVFLVLGAVVMYGAGERFADAAIGFSAQLVDLYVHTLGEWSRPLIAVAALSVMFSTTLAVTDAYPRVLRGLAQLAMPEAGWNQRGGRRVYLFSLAVVVGGALTVIHLFGRHFTAMVDFATTVSFLSAPVLAGLNYRLVTHPAMPAEHRPGPGLRAVAWAGMVFLVGFSGVWAWWRIWG